MAVPPTTAVLPAATSSSVLLGGHLLQAQEVCAFQQLATTMALTVQGLPASFSEAALTCADVEDVGAVQQLEAAGSKVSRLLRLRCAVLHRFQHSRKVMSGKMGLQPSHTDPGALQQLEAAGANANGTLLTSQQNKRVKLSLGGRKAASSDRSAARLPKECCWSPCWLLHCWCLTEHSPSGTALESFCLLHLWSTCLLPGCRLAAGAS